MPEKDKQKNKLEIILLRWDYQAHTDYDAARYRFRFDEHAEKGDPRRYLPLPEHDCRYKQECGLFLEAIEIRLGSDGHGKCELLHSKGVKSHTDHEFNLLRKELPPLFNDGERLSIGGCGITVIEFEHIPRRHFTDTGMSVYKKLLPLFGITDPREIREVKGPAVSRKDYAWSIELEGWVAFEDRLALQHGLRPIHATTGNYGNKPVQTFWWP